MHIERFAPSPTGLLHLGHAFSALTAFQASKRANGQFLLRIEDIDQARCRPEFEAATFADLRWLGITWPTPVMRQSKRMTAYASALSNLTNAGLTYPCTCTRRDIAEAISAPQEGGPDGPVYPGICKRGRFDPTKPASIRLDMEKAVRRVDRLGFEEIGIGPDGEAGLIEIDKDQLITSCGDIVLARKDLHTSYHLSVVVDDAEQAISHVTRGEDLFAATPIHCLLQTLLGLRSVIYRHHHLIRDDTGKRLAKRDDSRSIEHYRAEGWTPADVRAHLGLTSPRSRL